MITVEKPRGHWDFPYKGLGYAFCSICGKPVVQTQPFNFCPHCGSDMREDEIEINHVEYDDAQCGREK